MILSPIRRVYRRALTFTTWSTSSCSEGLPPQSSRSGSTPYPPQAPCPRPGTCTGHLPPQSTRPCEYPHSEGRPSQPPLFCTGRIPSRSPLHHASSSVPQLLQQTEVMVARSTARRLLNSAHTTRTLFVEVRALARPWISNRSSRNGRLAKLNSAHNTAPVCFSLVLPPNAAAAMPAHTATFL